MILPQEKRYKGPLGEFTYNSADFELAYRYTPFGGLEVLKYRGSEIEGEKIKIPDGIVDCSYMFEKLSIRTAPVIPVSVRTVNYMFKDCVSLIRGTLLPYGTRSASFMYQGCRSLESCSALPDTLENAQYMFDGCRSLVLPPKMPARLKQASGMFRGCQSLCELADFPKGVISKKHVYRDCKGLKELLGSAYEESQPVDEQALQSEMFPDVK